MATLVSHLDSRGFGIIPEFLSNAELGQLEQILPPVDRDSGGLRNLLDIPGVAGLAAGDHVGSLVHPVLGPDAFPIRAILLDKTEAANWKVSWHQDLTIAVMERREEPGYGPWSSKQGVVHVQPPAAVLEQMLAVRLHLDESGAGNGPLRVLPGSHRAGKLRDQEIPAWRQRTNEEVCLVPRGGALIMRPLLLHSSSPATEPHHRRVLHIEYSNCELPAGLEWRWAKRGARAA
jgi:ectoine hydroxylase-related dioxygenase (phytanoyl-CoA dioxygenase family)